MSAPAIVLLLVLLAGAAIAITSRVRRAPREPESALTFEQRMQRHHERKRRDRAGLSASGSAGVTGTLLGAWFIEGGGFDGGGFDGGGGDGGGS